MKANAFATHVLCFHVKIEVVLVHFALFGGFCVFWFEIMKSTDFFRGERKGKMGFFCKRFFLGKMGISNLLGALNITAILIQ